MGRYLLDGHFLMGLAIADQEDLPEGTAAETLLVLVGRKGPLYLFAIEF
jgi:hypothetical protein